MIRTLVADDQATVAAAHREFVERVPGFACVGVVHDGRQVLAWTARGEVDLLLLDLAMPELTGLEVMRTLRARANSPDVVVISAARDLDAVRECVRLGAVHYLIKPFTFAALRQKLEHYASYRELAGGDGAVTDQAEIDAALSTLRDAGGSVLPKGLSRETLAGVRGVLRAAQAGVGAQSVAEDLGISRVTARRYLEHLVKIGSVERLPVYGRTGRPELIYRPR